MQAAKQHIPAKPGIPDKECRILRLKLIAEELVELASASKIEVIINVDGHRYRSDINTKFTETDAIVETADAIADLLYVVYGAAVAWGIRIDPIFGEVHRSNMTKFIDGYRREDGKFVKGPSYEPARIVEVLHATQGQ